MAASSKQPHHINFAARSACDFAFILDQQGGIPCHSSANARSKEVRESSQALARSTHVSARPQAIPPELELTTGILSEEDQATNK